MGIAEKVFTVRNLKSINLQWQRHKFLCFGVEAVLFELKNFTFVFSTVFYYIKLTFVG